MYQKETKKKLNNLKGIHCKNESYAIGDDKLYFKKAKGAFVYDYDDNKYLDFSMGAGTTIFGHTPPFLVNTVKKTIDNGTIFTAPNMKTHELACKLNKLLYLDDFVFCNSGSEATSRAMRIARAYTGKRKIAVFSGGWHGGHDYGLVDDIYNKGDNSVAYPNLKSAGVPSEIMDTMLVLPYNDNAAFDIIKQEKNDIAAVFIEPSQGSNPRSDMKSFLNELRKVTNECNILLCFDEIITGFRVALGGAQEYYNIDIDIATYAKAIGGGFPLGIVAGKSEIMQCIGEKSVFMGGTFSANPVSIASSLSVINHLAENIGIYQDFNSNINYMKNLINSYCKNNKIPVRIFNFGSMFRFIFTDKFIKSRKERDMYELPENIQYFFYKDLLHQGIYIGSNRINFLSTVHTKGLIDEFVNKTINSLSKLKKTDEFP
jgi:glutamate-1-semialdehyde 2,1-aminomutase